MAEYNPCLSEQEDEVVALSAIFGEDFSRCENEECGAIYEIKIKVNLVGNKVQLCVWMPVDDDDENRKEGGMVNKEEINEGEKKIIFKRSESKQHSCLLLSVSHLTPLRLEFSFPSDYPALSKPLYTLSCLWLDVDNLSRLCAKLDQLWEESKGEPIIFPWVDWLQNTSLEFLGAYESINLKPYEWDQDECHQDPRALTKFLEPKACALEILQYDFHMEQQEFRKDSHVCEICFEEKEGILFHFIHECGHKFCVECLLDYCQMHVNEGTVKQLICPENKCKASLSPIILRELLSDEDYYRWERLLFQQTLDSMADVLYCPRCNVVVIQDEDEESNLAQCRECYYSFCTECHMAWHATQPCGGQEVENVTQETKKVKKRRKAKTRVGPHQEEPEVVIKLKGSKASNPTTQSYQFLMLQKRLGNYQRCPKCRIMVERTTGCDMMHCSRCGQSFCWRCGKKISGYDHFPNCGHESSAEIQRRAQAMHDNRPVAEGLTRMRAVIDENPGMKMKLKICPRCHQKNMKEHRNNHMKCWSCKFDFCYQCGKQTGSPVSSHFSANNLCKQHSDD